MTSFHRFMILSGCLVLALWSMQTAYAEENPAQAAIDRANKIVRDLNQQRHDPKQDTHQTGSSSPTSHPTIKPTTTQPLTKSGSQQQTGRK